ncbi:MAG TPA: hypothetical protein VFS43_16210 [Polyangiaceae bacterium]|nr:hypothetical protein [Polyangiaceae bacterium]
MRDFFVLLQRADAPAVLEGEARSAWGDAAVDALLRAGVVRRDAADWHPCGGPHGFGCPRRVRENPGDAKRPLLAVCGQRAPACGPVPLARGEASQLLASLPDLGRAVGRLLGLEGELAPCDASMPHTLQLGRRRGEGGAAGDVLLTRAAWEPGFGGLLAERAAHPRPSLVLAPTAAHVRSDLVARYAAPGRVQLAFLEDILTARGGELALSEGGRALLEPAARASLCRALTDRGERALDRAAYDAFLRDEAHAFDFVLDAVDVSRGRHATAWRRDERGGLERVELTRHEAEALAELVERAAVTRAGELACLRAAGVHDAVRVVERARQKVDVRVARYAWRAFATIGGRGDERAYHFAPPPGFRYACLLPPHDAR